MNPAIALPAFLSLVLLSGCSGGPTDEEATAALGPKVRDVTCKEAVDQPGYNCTVVFVSNGDTMSRRFLKTDGVWKVVGY